MKSRLLPVLFLALSFCPSAGAQDRPAAAATSFGRNHFLLSLSYGFPARLYSDAYFRPALEKKAALGPLMLRVEIPVNDVIGISALVQFAQQRSSATENGYGGPATYEGRSRAIGGGAMASYHFQRLIPAPKLDVYAGLGLGILQERQIVRVTGSGFYTAQDERRFSGAPLMAIGLRYYFLRRLAVFAEGGYTGLSFVNAGLTLHLPN